MPKNTQRSRFQTVRESYRTRSTPVKLRGAPLYPEECSCLRTCTSTSKTPKRMREPVIREGRRKCGGGEKTRCTGANRSLVYPNISAHGCSYQLRRSIPYRSQTRLGCRVRRVWVRGTADDAEIKGFAEDPESHRANFGTPATLHLITM